MKSSHAATIGLVLIGLVVGCASSPVQTYTGPQRAPEQVAQFECGFGVRLKAIDRDSRYKGDPIICKFEMLPGSHEFVISFDARDYNAEGTWRSKKDYVVPLKLVAGRRYSLHAFLDAKKKEGFIMKLADSSRKDLVLITNLQEAQ